jgi:MFS family permease
VEPFKTTVTEVALLTGYFLLGVGVAGVFFVASARIWGKRHLFLLGTFLLVVSSVWAGADGDNYTSFLWSRIFQGFATAPFEALVNAVVGDLYFVHVSNVAFVDFFGYFILDSYSPRLFRSVGSEWRSQIWQSSEVRSLLLL